MIKIFKYIISTLPLCIIRTALKPRRGNSWVGILILLTFLTTLGLALITEVVGTIVVTKRSTQTISAQALCDAGIEKAIWRLNETGGGYAGETGISLGTGDLDIAVTNIDQENKEILATAYVPSRINAKVVRKVKSKITAQFNETDVSFHYGIQAGGLGVTLANNAKVTGNIYSSRNVICNSNNNSVVTGDIFVSGTGNMIDNCNVGNDAKADSVTQSRVTRNVYYHASNQGSTYANAYPIPLEQLPPEQNLPINQTTIEQWEGWAEAGGTINGNYVVNGAATLGPQKINGNLTVNGGSTLTLTGLIWVTGDIITGNGSTIKLANTFGANSSMIIADSPSDKINYGKIRIDNGTTILGSGNPSSYIMLLSTNTGPTTSNPAISVGNNSTAVIYYSTIGMIEVRNNAHLRAITGGGLYLWNNAEITYDTGLADANFSGGPGGSWQLTEWQIVH